MFRVARLRFSQLGAMAFFATAAAAADIHVLSAAAVKGPLMDAAAAFERDTGNRVVLEFMTAGQVESRIAAGARPDIAVNTPRPPRRAGREGSRKGRRD